MGAIEGFFAFNESVAWLRNATYRADIRLNYNKHLGGVLKSMKKLNRSETAVGQPQRDAWNELSLTA